jgi:hypothetical protein
MRKDLVAFEKFPIITVKKSTYKLRGGWSGKMNSSFKVSPYKFEVQARLIAITFGDPYKIQSPFYPRDITEKFK